MRRLSLAVISVTLSATLSYAGVTQVQLESALKLLKAKRYEKAISKTKPLLDALKLDTVEQIIMAHKILGVSYCELGDQKKASEHFKSLVTFSPTESIDEVVVTKPCANLFALVRSPGDDQKIAQATNEISTSAATVDPKSKPTEATNANRNQVSPTTTSRSVADAPRTDARWLRFVPFGTGQFANGQGDKGMAFLATETVALGGAIAGHFLFQSEKNPDGTYDSPSKASFYRGLFWSSVGVGSAAAIWGVVDAVLTQNHQSAKTSLQVTPRSFSVAWGF